MGNWGTWVINPINGVKILLVTGDGAHLVPACFCQHIRFYVSMALPVSSQSLATTRALRGEGSEIRIRTSKNDSNGARELGTIGLEPQIHLRIATSARCVFFKPKNLWTFFESGLTLDSGVLLWDLHTFGIPRFLGKLNGLPGITICQLVIL